MRRPFWLQVTQLVVAALLLLSLLAGTGCAPRVTAWLPDSNGAIRLWDLDTGQVLQTLK